MTATIEDKSTAERLKLLDLIGDFTEELNQDIETSKTLSELGMGNTLTNYLDEVIRNPLKASVESIVAQEKLVSIYLDRGVRDFLKSKKRLVYKAFKTHKDPSILHYCIILNHDTLANRGKLKDFKLSLIYAGLDNRFPVMFQYIQKEFESELTDFESIKL
jgi:hypothetical protein